MARLIPALLLLASAAAAQPDASQEQFRKAGVCSRCHVVSVLEWSISAHAKKGGPNCQGCHGPSRGHVADERNGVKPDRWPRATRIAGLCLECHAPRCPKTSALANCQQCHHPHALLNPSAAAAAGQPVETPPAAPRASSQPRAAPPQEFRVADLGIELLLIPAGDFDMGSEKWPASSPVHTVHVDAFYLGKTEVTQAQWQAVMGTNPSARPGPQLPVERVSWEDCQVFLRKLNARVSGAGFRLPTEAEWEYAARAGASAPSSSLSSALSSAWFRENSGSPSGDFPQIEAYAPHPVGTKFPNRWGLFDLFGNVWEWCSSLDLPYPFGADGRESLTAPGKRILRGGSFADSAAYLDAALRHSERPDRRYQWNGLRLARSGPAGIVGSAAEEASHYLVRNRAEGLRVPSEKRGKRTHKPFVRPEQFTALVELIQKPYATMVYVAVYTGLRVSELIGLRWGDIHEHSITIDERYCRGDWGEPKSDASNTTIPVNQKVIERIHRLRTLTVEVKAGRARRRYPAVKSDGLDDLVFQSVLVSQCVTTISWCGISSRPPGNLESHG